MALMRLFLKPGIDKQNTEYGAEGGWIDGDYIRFRYGLPEKMGGWTVFGGAEVYLVGNASEVFSWNALDGSPYLAVGTNRKLYAYNGGVWADITPIRSTTAAGDVTFAAPYSTLAADISATDTTLSVASATNFPDEGVLLIGSEQIAYAARSGVNFLNLTRGYNGTTAGSHTTGAGVGSFQIRVADTSHGAVQGDFVTYSGVDASGLGGNITQAILQSEFEITSIASANAYYITSPSATNASDIGNGGAAVVGQYQISVGSDISFFDYGWGVGTWGLGGWGTARPVGQGLISRVWQLDSFGEDLICQLVDGGIYYWDTSGGLSTRAVAIAGAPTKSKYALVSTPDRHLVCFGTEGTVGTASTQDPMFVRFSAQEDPYTFTESATNTAGGQRLTDGSFIVSAVRSRGQILIWTDTSIHGQQYVGPPYTFGFQQLGANCGCIGPHAAIDVNGVAYWMSFEAFYVFDGTVKKIPCTVQDYVFKNLNVVQGQKTFVGVNTQFNEVTWWYCTLGSDYIDRFVTFNYVENVWSVGTMPRTAWQDIGTYPKPTGAEYLQDSTEATISTIYGLTAGRTILFNQEDGYDGNGESIDAYIRSGYFDIGDGDNMLLMSRFIPDFKNQLGNLTVRLLLRPYPQAPAVPSTLDPYVITPTTQKVDTRARGRQISLGIESSGLETNWRYGTLRVDIQPDGLR